LFPLAFGPARLHSALGKLATMSLEIPRAYHRSPRTSAIAAAALFLTAVSNAVADTSAPLHNWTVHIGNGAYGFTSWAPGYWNMYVGSRLEPGASVSAQYAAVVLPTLTLGVIVCYLAVVLLRLAVRWRRPNPPDSVDGGIGLLFHAGRVRPAATDPGC
jgi:hypothetical protein